MKLCTLALFVCLARAGAEAAPYEQLKLADSLSEAGRPDSALVIGRALIEQYPRPAADSDTAWSWIQHRMGNYHFTRGDLDSARVYWTRASELYASQKVGVSKRTGILNNLALLESLAGHDLRASRALEQALAIHRAAGTDTTREAATVMINLAKTFVEIGREEEALALYDESIGILKRVVGPEHWLVALNVGNTGIVYMQRGQDGMAERCFRESIRIARGALGPDHPRVAQPESNLAYLLTLRGRLDEAHALLQDALRIMTLAMGETHPDLIQPLSGLGNLYRTRGEFADAEAAFRRALALSDSLYGDTAAATASQLHNVALTLVDQKRLAEAESLWERAERIWVERGMGTSFELLKASQQRMLAAESREAAERHRVRLLRLVDTLYGGQAHQARGTALLAVSKSAASWREWELAIESARASLSVFFDILAENARYLNERDALAASSELQAARDQCIVALLAGGKDPVEVSDTGISNLLSSVKGLTAEVLSARWQTRDSLDLPALSGLRSEYDAVRVELAGRFAKADSWQNWDDRLASDSLRRLADSLESQLALETGGTGRTLATGWPLADFFRRHIDAVLIDYIRLGSSPGEFRAAPRYVALVHGAGQAARIVDLGEPQPTDSLISAYRKHLLELSARPGVPGPADRKTYEALSGAMRARIWDPVLQVLEAPGSFDLQDELPLYVVCTDGPLGLVSLGTLSSGPGRYLADLARFRYLSAPRRWEGSPYPKRGSHGLLVLGDPAFDSLSEFDLTHTVAPGGLALRSTGHECDTTWQRNAQRLPLSRFEAESAAALWDRAHGGGAMLRLGAQATERAVRQLAAGKTALHLATHGYYLDPACGASPEGAAATVHPLLLSGLMLAGANRHDANLPSEDDGMLSAYEVTSLDLSGVETVVLSACESGIGTHVASEGLYGLRHAFLLAGTRAVVCSLWPVSDRYTAAFMSRLYASGNTSVTLRLEQLQREERERLRRDGLSDHPLTWGAFIAFGSVD